MQLSTAQQAKLKTVHGICVNEVCDTCHKSLDHIRYTRKDPPGEWCSRVCRDGVEAAGRYKATRKQVKGRCWHCGLTLPGDVRADSKYCDATCQRNARRTNTDTRAAQIAA